MPVEEKTKELDDSIKSIRSQSDEKFGITIGSRLFDDLDRNGRLSPASIPDVTLENGDIVTVKILDNEFYVYRSNNDSYDFEIGPRSGALIHL